MARRLDVDDCRTRFPALSREIDGRPAVFFDGPAGSQVPRVVIDAVCRYLAETNANSGGSFATSVESDALLDEAHRTVAGFLGSDDPGTTIFGPNMTTLTLALARELGAGWSAGDEILVTRLEHDANFTPWVQVADEAGASVRYAGIQVKDGTLALDDLRSKLSERTRLVAVGAASNALGTVNPVGDVVRAAHAVGARVFVDAVHYAPHLPMDVGAWDCDFLVCSAYKFFGPHVGILWGRRELLEELPVHKLRPASDTLPGRWMPGTQNHEGIAGTLAAIDYLSELGFDAIRAHEQALSRRMLETLTGLDGVRVWGITDPARLDERVPTFSFTHERLSPREIADGLASRGIFVWHGNFYAVPVTEALGLEPDGMVRVGLLHYNTTDEIDRFGAVLAEL